MDSKSFLRFTDNIKRRSFLNPHTLIIVAIILALTYAYYYNLSMVSHSSQHWSWFWELIIFEFNYSFNGSLFYIPLLYAAYIFGWRGILSAWLCIMALNLPRIHYLSFSISSFVTNMFFLVIPLMAVIILTLLINRRRAARKAAVEKERERQAYLGMVLKAQEDERKRISREIHDDTIQRLWVAFNQIQSLIKNQSGLLPSETIAELEQIKQMLGQISGDAKRLCLDLRPGILDDLGLIPAIRWLIDQINQNQDTHIEARLRVEGQQRPLSSDINTHLYRITQEALNNARRHSEADRMDINLIFSDSNIKLVIQDNGKGIALTEAKKPYLENRLGLMGIQERVKLLGGIFKLNSVPGRGTSLLIEFSSPEQSHEYVNT